MFIQDSCFELHKTVPRSNQTEDEADKFHLPISTVSKKLTMVELLAARRV